VISTPVTIVIPCFNEAKNLHKLIADLKKLSHENVEIVLVNNGSTDDSDSIFLENQFGFCNVISIPKNLGYGYGLKKGIESSQGELIMIIHADQELEVSSTYFRFMPFMSPSNFVKGRRVGRKFVPYLFSTSMSVFSTIYFRRLLFEINAQPTVFPKNLIENPDDLPNDFLFDLCLYLFARKKRLKMIRVKVKLRQRYAGKSSWNRGLISQLGLSLRILRRFRDVSRHGFLKAD
jgi:glycosyltransferase involved in cell wall biosynthesis